MYVYVWSEGRAGEMECGHEVKSKKRKDRKREQSKRSKNKGERRRERERLLQPRKETAS